MLLDAGVEVALATDCNPGTSYTTSMAFVIAVACSEYGMSADEAVRAATLGGARALRRDDIGHLARGARGRHGRDRRRPLGRPRLPPGDGRRGPRHERRDGRAMTAVQT